MIEHKNAHSVAHHEAHQSSTYVFGFWVYLMTDCIIFGSLFVTFAVLHNSFNGGPTPHELFEFGGLGLETALLLASSITYGFGMLEAYKQNIGKVILWLGVTFLFGLGFIGLECKEFIHLVGEGAGPDRSGFLSAFFALVSTHGIHVTFGLIWIATLIFELMGTTSIPTRMMNKLSCLSLFWHFLDIVWICVFSYVYLAGMC